MNPHLATVLLALAMLALFRLQRDRTKTSIAIWIPVVWLALASSATLANG